MVSQPILPLRLEGAFVRRNGRAIIGPIDFEIAPKGVTIVMGPNGAGKTTLLRAMHGLERLSGGKVTWQVPDIEARKQQSYVFQSPVMMRRSVLGNVTFPLTIHGVPKKAARLEAEEWLERIGLASAAELQASVLSLGERQKLSLARALIRKPQILFLDEPCASLDGRSTRDIEALIKQAFSDEVRIVMSTHDVVQARRLASDAMFIYHGRLHETSRADEFFDAPQKPETKAFLRGEIVE